MEGAKLFSESPFNEWDDLGAHLINSVVGGIAADIEGEVETNRRRTHAEEFASLRPK